ncbi:MAG: Flp family type IVb pilin [Desulfatiglandales bacterium]
MTKLIRFLKDEDGATAIEYGLLAAGISIAIVGVVWLLGTQLFNLFTDVEDKLANPPGGGS